MITDVCQSVCLSSNAFLHYCMHFSVTLEMVGYGPVPVCVYVSVSVCHKSVCCYDGVEHELIFWHGGFLFVHLDIILQISRGRAFLLGGRRGRA